MDYYKKIFNFILKFIIIFCILFYLLMLTSCSRTKRYDDVTKFKDIINKVNGADYQIPSIDELGEYESIALFYKDSKQFVWTINTLTLKVKYNSDEFENALNNIDLNYSFLKQTKDNLFDYTALIDGYEIQVVDKPESMTINYHYHYPKCFLMIGVNKQECTIVYLYHYDLDLDRIKDLDNYIEKYYVLE